MADYVLAIDQGRAGTTAVVIDALARVRGRGSCPLRLYTPRPGWVEYDAEEIWTSTRRAIAAALRAARLQAKQITAIGVANQRDTTVLWDCAGGKPLSRALGAQDQRTAVADEQLAAEGVARAIQAKTGLHVDANSAGMMLRWMLGHVKGLRRPTERLAFGTVDSWLIWKLTGGQVHTTDVTNASRTMLFDIHRRQWDDDLLRIFDIPAEVLPRVVPSAGVAGITAKHAFGAEVPIAGIAGNRQAALFGQGCVAPGAVNCTYGSSGAVLMATGAAPGVSRRGLVTTLVAAANGTPAYGLEGAVLVAGKALEWLRDGLGILKQIADSDSIARRIDSTHGAYLVPAFVGLAAPYWDPAARGAFVGLTTGVTAAHLVRATLESLAYQARDVVDTMIAESGVPVAAFTVDGGAAANNFLMQFQADLLGLPVKRPKVVETAALGAALLAGAGVGLWNGERMHARLRKPERVFHPRMAPERREALHQGWRRAVAAVRALGS